MLNTLLFLVLLFSANNVNEVKEIDTLLTKWHHAAAVADAETYFGYLAENAIFLGTDAKERWTKGEFKKWAEPYFKRKSAWKIYATERNIYLSNDKTFAWFDEVLVAGFGPARGSGILIKIKDGWKIKHYNLAMTIPNEIVKDVKLMVEKQLNSELK